jgi:hypothetical protein
LSAFPIWEYASDEEGVKGQDETWVRPVDAQVVRKGQWSLTVAAEFRARLAPRLGLETGHMRKVSEIVRH